MITRNEAKQASNKDARATAESAIAGQNTNKSKRKSRSEEIGNGKRRGSLRTHCITGK
jgi:hypothetical protein